MFSKKTNRRLFGLAAGAVAALGVGLGATTKNPKKATGGSGTLTIAATAGPISLDPTLSSNGVPQVWYPNLAYAPLIERLPNGQATPGLATSWGYSKNRLSFVINLRSGVKFSDGSALTGADVAAWLQRYEKKGDITQWLANVTKINATGPLQVTLKLSSPNPLIPYGIDQDGMAGDVVGSEGLADPTSLGSSTDGAGPYMLDTSQTIANSEYVYVKNPNYWDPSAQHYSEVIIKVISDENSILAALQDGQVQVAEGSATEASAAKSAGLNIEAAPSAMVGVYFGDIDGKDTPALKNVKVRQALNYAVNRAGITKALYGTYAQPTDQSVPKGVAGYEASLEKAYPYSPSKAKKLLAEAGYPKGFSFTLVEQPAVDSGDLLTQALVADWKAIGVNVTIKTTPSFSAYATLMGTRKYPATTLTFQYSIQIVDTLQLINHPALYNYMPFIDPTADKLAANQLNTDIETPQGTQAAQASESYMVHNGNLVPVSSTDALLFTTHSVGGVSFGTYPWPDPTEWKPAS
jgi:peptide/nickel transport system substrate-binding protein